MKVVILGKFISQSFPLTDNAVEIDDETLKQIGKTKCFDVENNCVIDYDCSTDLKLDELNSSINTLKESLQSTDYVAVKISEAQLIYQVTQDDTKLLELYEEYKDVINQRELWREEIREKELELKQLKEDCSEINC